MVYQLLQVVLAARYVQSGIELSHPQLVMLRHEALLATTIADVVTAFVVSLGRLDRLAGLLARSIVQTP